MHVLALDSTTRAGSVAIVRDDRILLERFGDANRTHAERLPGELLSVLSESGLALSQIDLYAVASGPGSFTGLRVGIATIQGLAFTARARVAPVSALEALGHLGSRDEAPGTIVGVWMDAHRREVFSALYRVTSEPLFSVGRLEELDAPGAAAPSEVLDRWTRSRALPAVMIGDGATLYTSIIGSRSRLASLPPAAGAIGAIAAQRARLGHTVDPAGIQPLYIRRPDAEVARERAASLEDKASR